MSGPGARRGGGLGPAALALAALSLAGCGGEAEPPPDPRTALGRQVFTEIARPTCATCHVLADAGATGAIGPNLDQLRPTPERVAAAVTGGVGIMPAFGGTLTAEQIEAVAHYVSRATGGATDAAEAPGG